MLRSSPKSACLALAMLVGGLVLITADSVQAGHPHHHFRHGPQPVVCRDYQYGNPDLFYNYFVPPNCGGVGAALYPAPLPVPQHVGHVYYTYQPFLPHEHLYHHHRTYHRYYDEGRGLTRTSVLWW